MICHSISWSWPLATINVRDIRHSKVTMVGYTIVSSLNNMPCLAPSIPKYPIKKFKWAGRCTNEKEKCNSNGRFLEKTRSRGPHKISQYRSKYSHLKHLHVTLLGIWFTKYLILDWMNLLKHWIILNLQMGSIKPLWLSNFFFFWYNYINYSSKRIEVLRYTFTFVN